VVRHRERSLPIRPRMDGWIGYCQFTPTDMLAHDHC
jgi:hypothetical protein